MKLKALLLSFALLACLPAFAGTVTVNWSSPTDPAVGWNGYMNHLQTPDALGYLGTYGASTRTITFLNISMTGLYQFGVSRVEYVDVAGVNRRIESSVEVITILDGQLIATPGMPGIWNVTITP